MTDLRQGSDNQHLFAVPCINHTKVRGIRIVQNCNRHTPVQQCVRASERKISWCFSFSHWKTQETDCLKSLSNCRPSWVRCHTQDAKGNAKKTKVGHKHMTDHKVSHVVICSDSQYYVRLHGILQPTSSSNQAPTYCFNSILCVDKAVSAIHVRWQSWNRFTT